MEQIEINNNWQKISGEKIDDLEKYIYDQLTVRPDIKIMIGTDSVLTPISKNKNKIVYLSVIVFRKGTNGCHVIKKRDEVVNNYHVTTAEKLNGEINRTSALALYLREVGIEVEVHLDINPNPEYGSFEVYKYIKGYFESLEFICLYKPDSPASSYAADYFI